MGCNALYLAWQEEYDILYFWTYFIEKLPKWLYLPLGGCLKCMASIWGSALFLAFSYLFGTEIGYLTLPLAILIISYFNLYLYKLLPD